MDHDSLNRTNSVYLKSLNLFLTYKDLVVTISFNPIVILWDLYVIDLLPFHIMNPFTNIDIWIGRAFCYNNIPNKSFIAYNGIE